MVHVAHNLEMTIGEPLRSQGGSASVPTLNVAMNTIAINLRDINGDCSLPCTRSPSRPQSKTPNTLFLRCEKHPNTTPAIKHYNTRLICTVEVNESCPCVIKQFSETTPHLLRTAPLPSNLKLWLLSYRTPVWCPSLE